MKRSSGWLAVAVLLLLVGAGVAAGTGGPPPLPADGGFVPLLGCRPRNCTMPDGCPGVSACDGNGDNLPCDYNGNNKSCTACGQTGYQTCPVTDNVCHVTNMSQGCTACSTSGTQTCNNVPGGTWNACVVPNQSCSQGCGTGYKVCTNGSWSACQGCTGQVRYCNPCQPTVAADTCTSDCRSNNPTCTLQEICNNCDDNGDGNVDEGLHCSCGL